MNTPDELDARLLKADPAKNAKIKPLSADILAFATRSKPKLGLGQQFELLTARAKNLALGGLVSGTAVIAAVAIVINPTPAPLIQMAASQAGDSSRTEMASDGAPDKMMIMPYVTYEYLAGPGLSNEVGSGQVYKLVRSGTAESVLQNLASVFGVQGSVKKYPDFSADAQGYFFGESDDPWGGDFSMPSLSIWWSGTASWSYSSYAAGSVSSLECRVEDGEGYCEEYVEAVPTPELLPTREEAIAKALEIFNLTGLPATEADLRVDYSEWGVSISSALKVDGQPTSIEWYLGWSSDGVLSYAGGHSVVAEAVGEFATISPVQAIERLDDWRWFGSPATSYYEKYAGDSSITTSNRSEEAVEPGASTSVEAGATNSEDQPEPELITLTIQSAERALLSIWDASGDVWLVPGLLMVNDQGWWSSVISIIDGVIALPEPSTFDIMPMPEPAPGDSSVSD
jgi:hypothetical protein